MITYKVQVTLDLEYEMKPADALEDPTFFFEEHLCVDNLLERLERIRDRQTSSRSCVCYLSKVKYIGMEIKE